MGLLDVPMGSGALQAVPVLLGLSDKTEDDIGQGRDPPISPVCQPDIILFSTFFSSGVMELWGS